MVKIKKSRKDDKEILPLDNPEVLSETLSKSEKFISTYKNIIFIFFGALLLIISAFSIFSYLKTSQNVNGQDEMFQAVYYFEKDSLVQALNGDGNNYGFLEIIDESMSILLEYNLLDFKFSKFIFFMHFNILSLFFRLILFTKTS